MTRTSPIRHAGASVLLLAVAAIALASCDSGQVPEPASPPRVEAEIEPAVAMESLHLDPVAELPVVPAAAPPPAEPIEATAAAPEPPAPLEPPAAQPAAEPIVATAAVPEPPAAHEPPALDLALRERIAAAIPEEGAALFDRHCADCHTANAGGGTILGPNLFGVVERTAGSGRYAYSAAFLALREQGVAWDFERLDAFLMAPGTAVPGTRMVVGDVADAFERANIIAFLRLAADTPQPIEGVVVAAADTRAPPSFTTEQVDAGRALYQAGGCSFCHGDDLLGLFDFRGSEYGGGPALVGGRFLQSWRAAGLDALFVTMRDRMPPNARGSLPAEAMAEILAYILDRNGFTPDGTPLTTDATALAGMSLRQAVAVAP